jgi:predicted CoA-binding protein
VSSEQKTVVVLGASPKPERYSNQAVRSLLEHGHRVVPVRPGVETIEGLKVAHRLGEVSEDVHTLTVYVSKKVSSKLEAEIAELAPGRVIFNPGAENAELRDALEARGIPTVEACTLVMLRTGQF